MNTLNNILIKYSIIIILIAALSLSGFFYISELSYGLTKEETTTYYRLDTGVVFLWCNSAGVWQKGWKPLENHSWKSDLIIPANANNVSITSYESSASYNDLGYFPFAETSEIKRNSIIWNKTKVAFDKFSYDYYYYNYSTNPLNISGIETYNPSTGNIIVNYTAAFRSMGGSDYNVKEKLSKGATGKQEILDLLGEPVNPEVADAMNLMDPTSEVYNENVQGYLYFTPIVIKYDITEIIELGELDAQLSLPDSAKQEENYNVSDATVLSEHLTIQTAILEKHYGDENWQTVATWKGIESGQNTGGIATEIESDICTITYRLTVTTEDGQVDIDIENIDIIDNRKIEATAILELPEYTYEGHSAHAVDVSEFKVDGISYSARRAYEESVATNSFSTIPANAGKATRESKTAANVVFPQKGNYNVKLTIDTIDGDKLTDTKPIEVRKTPYIIDRLGGFQKQNRKQLLNISVATFPDKPIVDYYIEIKDLKTNQSVTLTKDQLQQNNSTIKTRPHITNGDYYWTNFDLEFLTKNTIDQDFQYTIYVKDSKGDTDLIQRVFPVARDLPPNIEILMQDSFIRNKSTNTAEVIAEDGTATDGDQLQRTWTINGRNLRDMPGYQDLSFQSLQKVKFDKTGVGKVTLRLDVKEIWNEPTLSEYITNADYLAASITKTTDVINIAPTVRLEPLKAEKADVFILAKKASKSAIETDINNIKAKMIESGFDSSVQLISTADANNNGYRNVGHWEWPVSVNCQTCRTTGLMFDSDYAYKIESAGRNISGYQEICTAPHTIYALMPSEPLLEQEAKIAWSYTVNESNNFSIQLDNLEKYIYIQCKDTNKTILLNRNNGAYVTTLDLLIPSKPFLGSINNNLYFLMSDKIQKLDSETGKVVTVINKGGCLGRILDGKITFVGAESSNRFYIGKFDMNTERLDAVALPELPGGSWNGGSKTAISPTDMDSQGRVTFTQTFNDSDNDTRGCFIWLVNSKDQTVKLIIKKNITNDMRMNSVGFVKNEIGQGVYMYHGYCDDDSTSSTTRRYFTLKIYTLGDKYNEPEERTIYSQKNNRLNWSGISYAKLHSGENAIYIMQGADFGWNGLVQGVQCRISLPSWSTDFNQYHWGWDVAEEHGEWNDSLMATYYSADQWMGMTHRVKLFRNSITAFDAEKSALQRHGNFRDDAKRIVIRDFNGDIDSLMTRINNVIKEKATALKLFGKDDDNEARISREIVIDKGQKYQYEYDMVLTTGRAVDVFKLYKEGSPAAYQEGEVRLYSEFVAARDFSVPGDEPFFFGGTSYYLNSDYGYSGLGSGYYGKKKESESYSCWLQVDMDRSGYIEFDFFRALGTYSSGTYSIILDGRIIETGSNSKATHMLYFLEEGVHRFDFYGNKSGCIGLNNVKAIYLYESDNIFIGANLKGFAKNIVTKIRNTFTSSRQEAFTKKISEKGVLKRETFQGNQVSLSEIISFKANNNKCPWVYNEETGTATIGSGYYDRASGSMTIKAPEDKLLVVNFEEAVYSPQTPPVLEGNVIPIGLTTVVIPPGQTMEKSYTLTRGRDGYNKYGWVSISDIKIVTFHSEDYSPEKIFLEGNYLTTTINTGAENFTIINFVNDDFILTDYTNIGGGKTDIKDYAVFTTRDSKDEIGAYISNFRLYRVVENLKQLLLADDFDANTQIEDNNSDESIWNRNIKGYGEAKIEITDKSEEEKKAPLIYKKGELVSYHIIYEDYENDPSKKQYWKYTHTPYNDGAHPNAAVILDEDGNMVSSQAAILSNSIPRFYIDGKYTVEHWQEDNTNRTGDGSGDIDYFEYDKLSNIETITFYIEGGATAPWITSIETLPETVKEGDAYKIQIGVDDVEKDELRLTTELYKDKKLIYTHKKNNIIADDKGVYPYVITGFAPLAVPGVYEVVCTVRDESGAGLGSYRFTVVSEGKITGFVNHTEQWDINRKKYNLKRFSDEINRTFLFSDYLALSIPRQRGTNVFWSGEKFVLKAEAEGEPIHVSTRILNINGQGVLVDTGYHISLTKTAVQSLADNEIWAGSLWDNTMINRWGRKNPEELIFLFEAEYENGKVKEYKAPIIVDSGQDYWQLHRLW